MKPLLRSALAASLALAIVSLPTLAAPAWPERADQFLALVNAGYQALYRVESEAQWLAGLPFEDRALMQSTGAG